MTYDKHDCDLMCERLAAYLEGDLPDAERAEAERHLAECGSCAEVLSELRAITAAAEHLPLLEPARDLWSGIAARIDAPVTHIGARTPTAIRAPRRQWQYAIAAGALIALGAGGTYLLTGRTGAPATQATTVATTATPSHTDTIVALTAPSPRRNVPASADPGTGKLASAKKELSAARVYDHEIVMLDSLVRTRRESLDPKTVAVIQQNLKIIDQAIAESRAALAKDPKSPLLSNQLDNVLGTKVELLRTIAFLPTQS